MRSARWFVFNATVLVTTVALASSSTWDFTGVPKAPELGPCPKTEIHSTPLQKLEAAESASLMMGFMAPEYLAKCHEGERSPNFPADIDKARAEWAKRMLGGVYRDHWDPIAPNAKGGKGAWTRVKITSADLEAFDALTRTLAGEISYDDCKAETKAVARVIYNRAQKMTMRRAEGVDTMTALREFGDAVDEKDMGRSTYTPMTAEDKASLNSLVDSIAKPAGYNRAEESKIEKVSGQHPIVTVVTASRRFSCWDPESKARPLVLCPSKWVGSKRRFREIVAVAAQMIFDEKTFREETDHITSVFYTSGDRMHAVRLCQGYDLLKDQYIIDSQRSPPAKVSIGNPHCIELWKAPKVPNKCDLPERPGPKPAAAVKPADARKPAAATVPVKPAVPAKK